MTSFKNLRLKHHAGTAIGFISIFSVYYFIFVHSFFAERFIPGGDTLALHTTLHTIFSSIRQFGELPWWEPRMQNGMPFYILFTANEINIARPHTLIFIFAFKILAPLMEDISHWIFLYEFIYNPLLISILIFALGHCLTKRATSSLFGVLLFLFSYFTLLNFHDQYAIDALPEPLLVLYFLFRFIQSRARKDFVRLGLSVAFLFVGLCYGTVFSAGIWLASVLFCLFLFYPSVFSYSLKMPLRSSRPRIVCLACAMYLVCLWSAYLPLRQNADVLRYRGGKVSLAETRQWATKSRPIERGDLWQIALHWYPYPYPRMDAQGLEATHDNRYLGIASFLLIVLGALCSLQRRLFWVLGISYLITNAFIVLTSNNLAYAELIEWVPLLKVFRNMSTIFPRGAPALSLVLCAVLGFSAVSSRRDFLPTARQFARHILILSSGLGVISCAISAYLPSHFRECSFHVGLYCFLFSFLLLRIMRHGAKPALVTAFFILTFMDLVTSQSAHMLKRTGPPISSMSHEPIGRHVRYPYHPDLLPPRNVRLIPRTEEGANYFLPISGPSERYRNIYLAPKHWLVLATHQELASSLLPSWNHELNEPIRYPDFEHCNAAKFVPLELLQDPIQVASLIHPNSPALFVHGQQGKRGAAVHCTRPREEILKFSFNELSVRFDVNQDGILLFRSNFDPLWTAKVDETPVKLFRANFTFTGMLLNQGTHVVKFSYRPQLLKFSMLIAYIMILSVWFLCSQFSIRSLFKKKRLFFVPSVAFSS